MSADRLTGRPRVGVCLGLAVALVVAPRAVFASGWVEFIEESATRMIADAGVGLDDVAEKDFAVGDVDLDGDDDLVVVRKVDNGSSAGDLPNVLFMNENGVLVDRTAELIPEFLIPATDRDVILIDVDGDGWLDIVTAPANDTQPRLYMNQGEIDGEWQGYVWEPDRLPFLDSPVYCGVAAGDIDDLNGPDLYFVEYNSGSEDRLLMNDGTGFFTDETDLRITASSADGPFTTSVFGTHTQIVDMNGDGAQDIIKCEDGPVEIAFNDGTGFFDTMQVAYNGGAYHFATFDLDNDGDLDFYVADDGTDRYVINTGTNPNGTVNFIAYTAASSTNGFGSNTLIADFNNDSFDDVMVADVDVDAPTCTGEAKLLRNTGVSGSGNLIDTLPLGSLTPTGVHDQVAIDLNQDGWLDLIVGKCEGYDIFINVIPEGIAFSYPAGLPTFVPPDENLLLTVQVASTGEVELQPNSGLLYLSIDGGAFDEIPMTEIGDGLYEATLPGQTCLTDYRFYVSASLVGGEEFFDPADAPAVTHEAVAAAGTEILLRDTLEDDVSGWEVFSDESLTAGEWELAEPNITIHGACGVMAPDADATNGDAVMAFVTQNCVDDEDCSTATDSDVDGAFTFLTSPVFDLSGTDGTITYSRWFRTCFGTSDVFTVEVTNDGGDTWTLVDEVGGAGDEWQDIAFTVSDFVEPTDNMRVRFSTGDPTNDSLTEAGVDNFQVEIIVCGDEEPCQGDLNGDGNVDPLDIGFVLARFGCPVGTGDPSCDAADLNGDGTVDPLDSGFVLARFGTCD